MATTIQLAEASFLITIVVDNPPYDVDDTLDENPDYTRLVDTLLAQPEAKSVDWYDWPKKLSVVFETPVQDNFNLSGAMLQALLRQALYKVAKVLSEF